MFTFSALFVLKVGNSLEQQNGANRKPWDILRMPTRVDRNAGRCHVYQARCGP